MYYIYIYILYYIYIVYILYILYIYIYIYIYYIYVCIYIYNIGGRRMQNNFIWYLKFHAGAPTIFVPG